MSATYNLTETAETIPSILTELQNNSTQAQGLRDDTKIPKTYDDPAIWADAATRDDVKLAFGNLSENLPTSNYASRARRRFSINKDALTEGQTSSVITSPTAIDDNRKSATAIMQWNDLGDSTTGTAEIVALDASRRFFTFSVSGVYDIGVSMCLGFYPQDSLTDTFADQSVVFTNSTMKGVGVRVLAEIYNGSTLEYCLTLFEGMLSRNDMQDQRKRFFGGSRDVQVNVGNKLRIIFQRDSRLGRFSKTVSGVQTLTNEGIGFSKYVPLDAINQQRDAQNWLEITRLA